MLGSQPQLRVLHIDLTAVPLSNFDLAILLGLTPHLEELQLTAYDEPGRWDDRGAALMKTLHRLPALKTLRICDISEDVDHLLTVAELALLSSPVLSSLDLEMGTITEGTLSFVSLPALVSCVLKWWKTPGEVHIADSSFSGAPNLTQLEIWGAENLMFTQHSLGCLSRLSDLKIVQCGLKLVTPALSAVQHTLKRLDLSDNRHMQIEACGFDILLDLPALVQLTFRDPPRLLHWNGRSIKYMLKFCTEWQALRPGVEPPTLFV